MAPAVTGRPYLFVDEDMTGAIIGMPEEDSDALLEELYTYLYANHNVYEQAWSTAMICLTRQLAWGRRLVLKIQHRPLERTMSVETFADKYGLGAW